MELTILQEELKKIKKGAFIKLHYKRTLNSSSDVRVAFKNRIVKETRGIYRFGIDYANMKINEGKTIGELKTGIHYDSDSEIIYNPNKNTFKLRAYNTFNPNFKPQVQWFLDGKEITKKELIEMGALGSNQTKTKTYETPLIEVMVENIISIGKED